MRKFITVCYGDIGMIAINVDQIVSIAEPYTDDRVTVELPHQVRIQLRTNFANLLSQLANNGIDVVNVTL